MAIKKKKTNVTAHQDTRSFWQNTGRSVRFSLLARVIPYNSVIIFHTRRRAKAAKKSALPADS